jgi:hypothetical protein
MTTEELLAEPINELGFTLAFKQRSRAMGFVRLSDIIIEKEPSIMQHPDYTPTWFTELVWFARNHGFLPLLEAAYRF